LTFLRFSGVEMAIVKKGSMLEGLTGRVGDLVFRTRGDQTIVSRRPRRRKRKGERSAARQQTITRFQEAACFAREARHRHAYRSLSRVLRGYSPYHVALQDYLSIPVIEDIDASGIGPEGGELAIRVSERVAVRAVRVRMTGQASRDPIPLSTRQPRVGPAEGLEKSAPDARLPIPAALFFKRVGPTDAKESEKPLPPEGLEPVTIETPKGTGATPREVQAWAKRRLGVQRKGDQGEAAPGQSEIWVVTLPRPGEVEIIASDYAGNRATQTIRVGPSMDR